MNTDAMEYLEHLSVSVNPNCLHQGSILCAASTANKPRKDSSENASLIFNVSLSILDLGLGK